jgi:hypothetical protein
MNNTFDILKKLVELATCKPGWSFNLQDGDSGQYQSLIFIISVPSRNSHDPEHRIHVSHLFSVPVANYSQHAWQRWMFECCRFVENHEIGEWFQIDGHRPFPPLHAPGENPYYVMEYRSIEDAKILQDGSKMEGEL